MKRFVLFFTISVVCVFVCYAQTNYYKVDKTFYENDYT